MSAEFSGLMRVRSNEFNRQNLGKERVMTGTAFEPKIGDNMDDGTVYAGVSPDTGEPMYAMRGAAPIVTAHFLAERYTRILNAHGHTDWRVPTIGEVNVLFNNRAAIGGFDETGLDPAGKYWSSSPHVNEFDDAFCTKRFSDGREESTFAIAGSASLRCVRG
jgi:hypothetical protein